MGVDLTVVNRWFGLDSGSVLLKDLFPLISVSDNMPVPLQ